MTDTPKTATEALEGVAPQPRYIEHIQFEGRDCVVLSPEEYEALWERALSALSDAQPVADKEVRSTEKVQPTLDELVAFLCGERELMGYWYGAGPAKAPYWWRKHLRAAAQSANAANVERDAARWNDGDPRRIFVEGAKWWQYHAHGSTASPSEVDVMEAEAFRRYAAMKDAK